MQNSFKNSFNNIFMTIFCGASFLAAQPNHTLPASLAAPGAPILTPRVTETVFGEGVAADWQGNVYYNEMGSEKRTMILPVGKDSSKEWRKSVDNPNGMWVDTQNRLVICQSRAIIRVNTGATYDNKVDTLYKVFVDNQEFNDVTGDSHDNLFFTNFQGNTVFFRNAATEKTIAILTNQGMPNGCEWDEERKRLYVGENGINLFSYYTVNTDFSLTNKTKVDSVKSNDGMVLDEQGNIYCVSYGVGVQVYSPDRVLLGKIPLPNHNFTNLAFGGVDFKTLYMITDTGLYKLPMKVRGYKSGNPTSALFRLNRNQKLSLRNQQGALNNFGSLNGYYILNGREWSPTIRVK